MGEVSITTKKWIQTYKLYKQQKHMYNPLLTCTTCTWKSFKLPHG